MCQPVEISNRRLEEHFSSLISGRRQGAALPRGSFPRAEAIIDLHTGSDMMIDLLDHVGDLALLQRYLSKPLPDLDRKACSAWLHRATADRDIDFIAELVRHGIRVEGRAHYMISSAVDAQDAGFLSFLRAALGRHYQILAQVGSVRAIDECTPSLATLVADDIRQCRRCDIPRHLSRGGKSHLSLKCTAALICSRVEMDQLEAADFHLALAPLIDGSRTATGRIHVLAAEPGLANILARPLGSVFFGFREAISTTGEIIVVPAQ